MYRLKLLFFIVALTFFSQAAAQTVTTELTKKIYQTYSISKDQAPEIDGR